MLLVMQPSIGEVFIVDFEIPSLRYCPLIIVQNEIPGNENATARSKGSFYK